MHIFLTGGTGTVGSACLQSLSSAGHSISALARSSSSATAVSEQGATPVEGDISNLELLRREADKADAVVYCAFDHTTSWLEQCALETKAITAICEGLSPNPGPGGRPKMLIYCTVPMTSFPPDRIANEETPLVNYTDRKETDAAVVSFSTPSSSSTSHSSTGGIRGVQLRLPMVVHTASSPPHFLHAFPMDDGVRYYADGSNRWPAVHASDVGDLVAKLLAHEEKIPPGKVTAVHAFSERVATKEIAEAVAENTGMPTRSLSQEEMGEVDGLWRFILPANPGVENTWTKETFGWEPKGNTLLEDIAEGKYFAPAPSGTDKKA